MTAIAGAEKSSALSLSAYGRARSTVQGAPLSPDEVEKIDAYWRACKVPGAGHDLSPGKPFAEGAA